MSRKVKGIIKKYNPQNKLLFLDKGVFSLKHLPSEITKNLKKQLEVELILDKKNNVINIEILNDTSKQKKQQKKQAKFSYKNKISNKISSKNGIYITPKYLLQYLGEEINNFYLRLNKYIFASVENPEKQKVPQDYKEAFINFLNGILKLKIENIPNITKFPKGKEIKDFINLYVKTLQDLENKGIYKIKSENFKPNSKLILGLGHPSIYEVSMTLHHIYGFPYIPAQAIKGVLRNYFINEYFDLSENKKKEIGDVKEISKAKENLAGENPIFEFIFGSEDNEGNIVFFDAYPAGDIKLQIDITNNHFPEYYKDDKNEIPPADWQNPNPVKFLVVKDTPFKVFIGIKRNVNLEKLKEKLNEFKEKGENHKKFIEDFENKLDSKENLLNHLFNHLNKAFEWYGIGAKTSVGYGYLLGK